ncbi:hypothetical protein LIA77_00978 [Sarocladium implicatum]|nr:hypothetical protein LIA77_00978 [Sarocladium implicatum]
MPQAPKVRSEPEPRMLRTTCMLRRAGQVDVWYDSKSGASGVMDSATKHRSGGGRTDIRSLVLHTPATLFCTARNKPMVSRPPMHSVQSATRLYRLLHQCRCPLVKRLLNAFQVAGKKGDKARCYYRHGGRRWHGRFGSSPVPGLAGQLAIELALVSDHCPATRCDEAMPSTMSTT